MPRTARSAPGGYAYHVLNRAVARLPLFEKDGDYEAFERILSLTIQKHSCAPATTALLSPPRGS